MIFFSHLIFCESMKCSRRGDVTRYSTGSHIDSSSNLTLRDFPKRDLTYIQTTVKKVDRQIILNKKAH